MCNFCKKTECQSVKDCVVLREAVCTKCNGKGHTSVRCNHSNVVVTCYFCHKTGHTVTDCESLKNIECAKCKGKGHTTLRCVETYCKIHKNTAHNTEDCPRFIKNYNKGQVYCNFCRQNGHTFSECGAFAKVECQKCHAIGKHTTKKCEGTKE